MNNTGYRNTPINHSFYLPVGDGHELYVESIGNPKGIPVIYLHGGPGAHINDKARWFFNPEKYNVILFDQRGTGKSQPFLSLENNTPFSAVEDIEKIRKHLNIDKWIVFGGSYGSTLGLVYGIHHPERIIHQVLRGIFLGRKVDIDWLFQDGSNNFYPLEHDKFRAFIAPEKQHDLVAAYYDLMINHPINIRDKACKHWADWENSILRLENDPLPEEIQPVDLSAGLLEAHFFANHLFFEEDNYILNNAEKLKTVPISIFHGRFDVDCRVKGAVELKKKCPHAELNIVQLGSHYPLDSPLFEELVDTMDRLAELYEQNFNEIL